jgi:hypothetical protein
MNASDILTREFGAYYTADELPASSAPDSDVVLRWRADDSVHRLARRAQRHIGELVALIDELIRDRKHPLFSEINDATLIAWNEEDADWHVMEGLLTYMRTGLIEIETLSDPRARDALLRNYRAYQCDEGGQRWYVIERVSTQTKVVHVHRIENQDRTLTIEYELTSADLTHTLARLLMARILLVDFFENAYAKLADQVEYKSADGIVCSLPIAYGLQ